MSIRPRDIALTGAAVATLKIPTGTSDPTAVGAGHLYYNTSTPAFRIYNGSAFVTLADLASNQIFTNTKSWQSPDTNNNVTIQESNTTTVQALNISTTGGDKFTVLVNGTTTIAAPVTINSGLLTANLGVTVTGAKTTLAATAAGFASLNLPPGTAPSSPANGDMWSTAANLFARIGSTTLTIAALEQSNTWTSSHVFNGAVTIGTLPLTLTAATTAGASVRIPHGAAPTSPVNGDMWTTSAGGLFVRINGATVGPLTGGGGSGDMVLATQQTVTGRKTFVEATTGPSLAVRTPSAGSSTIMSVTDNAGTVSYLSISPDSYQFGQSATAGQISLSTISPVASMALYAQDATSGVTSRDSGSFAVYSSRWNGAASAAEGIQIDIDRNSSTSGDYNARIIAGFGNIVVAPGANKSIRFLRGTDTTPTADIQTWETNSTTVLARIEALGKFTAVATSTTTASINLPHGTAPSSPVNGDMWTTSAGGLFVRINGATVGPLGSGGGGSGSKISALTGQTAPSGAVEFAVNDAGTSKKVNLGDIRKSYPTAPTFVSASAEFSSTATPTAILPTGHALNDILILVIHTSNQAFSTPAGGWKQIGAANGIGTAAAAGAARMYMFWKRDGGSETAPTLSDSGDHTYGFTYAIRGCTTTAEPFRVLGQNWKFTSSTTGTGPVGATKIDNCLIATHFAHHLDQAGAAASAAANSSLSSVTENFDDSTTDGTGGGLVLVTGIKQDHGDVTATTVTWSTTTADVSQMIAFVPADAFELGPRAPEQITFIGSSADLDDTWTKPAGAQTIFAQICDGGGSGSGGNTTTTAAGGGGGGGGGYDEAWFRADDLASTVTVHAGKGGNAGTALNQAGNAGVLSEFWKGSTGPLSSTYRITGTAATAAASADGGNGGCGSGSGFVSPAVATARVSLEATTGGPALGRRGGAGGSGTTAPVGGSPAEWGGGGGESGADTDAGTTIASTGFSMRGGGGGAGGRTNTTTSVPGPGGGAGVPAATQGTKGNDSAKLPYGGSGGVNGGSTTVTGGAGGFPGGGGGGGAGVAGGFGGRGGDGCVVVTTYF